MDTFNNWLTQFLKLWQLALMSWCKWAPAHHCPWENSISLPFTVCLIQPSVICLRDSLQLCKLFDYWYLGDT